MPEQTLKDIKSMRNWIRYGGIITIFLLCILALVVYYDRNNENDRREREAKSKVDARIEACHLYNVDQTARRNFQKENILTLVKLSGRDVATVESSPEFAQYIEFVDSVYQYRQCSTDCVNALYDPDIEDCLPANNEQGVR